VPWRGTILVILNFKLSGFDGTQIDLCDVLDNGVTRGQVFSFAPPFLSRFESDAFAEHDHGSDSTWTSFLIGEAVFVASTCDLQRHSLKAQKSTIKSLAYSFPNRAWALSPSISMFWTFPSAVETESFILAMPLLFPPSFGEFRATLIYLLSQRVAHVGLLAVPAWVDFSHDFY